jgi:hypothetical protein
MCLIWAIFQTARTESGPDLSFGAESLNTDFTRDRKPCATAIRRTDLCYLSTLRLAELGGALDMRSVGASPALRLLHPGCMFW